MVPRPVMTCWPGVQWDIDNMSEKNTGILAVEEYYSYFSTLDTNYPILPSTRLRLQQALDYAKKSDFFELKPFKTFSDLIRGQSIDKSVYKVGYSPKSDEY